MAADATTLAKWAAAGAGDGGRIADLCLALTTPAAAQFLAVRVRDTKVPDPRIGEFARHVALNLPEGEFESFTALLGSLAAAPAAQRLIAAEGLATIAERPQRVLPAEAGAWMGDVLFAALEDKAAIAVRAQMR